MSRPIDFYLSLITSEYQGKPKFLALVAVLLQKLDDVSLVADSLEDAFDIDSAGGVQLDILGEIVGQSRQVDFEPYSGASPVLNDTDYRTLLKAVMGKNHWDGLQDSLYPLWATLFPGGQISIQDHQDMTMSVYLDGDFSAIMIDLILNGYIVPRPQGVLINYYFGNIPLFGFDYYATFIDGFDIGNWYTPLSQG